MILRKKEKEEEKKEPREEQVEEEVFGRRGIKFPHRRTRTVSSSASCRRFFLVFSTDSRMRLFTSTLGSLGRLSSRPFLRPHIPQPRPVVLQPRCQFASGPVGFPRPRMRSNEYKRFGNQAPFYMSKRLWVFTGTATVLFGGYYVTHLEQVPLSGRYRFMDVTPGQEKGNHRKKKDICGAGVEIFTVLQFDVSICVSQPWRSKHTKK